MGTSVKKIYKNDQQVPKRKRKKIMTPDHIVDAYPRLSKPITEITKMSFSILYRHIIGRNLNKLELKIEKTSYAF